MASELPEWLLRRTRLIASEWSVGWGAPPVDAPEAFVPGGPRQTWACLQFTDPATRREWEVRIRLFERQGRYECGEVRLADRDGKGVGADDMRRFPWGSIISDVRADFAENQFQVLGPVQGLPQFTERGASEGKLGEVAEVYRRAVLAVQPPTLAVREFYGVSQRTAARWVSAARNVGILGPAVPGRAGEAEVSQ